MLYEVITRSRFEKVQILNEIEPMLVGIVIALTIHLTFMVISNSDTKAAK